MKLKNLIGQNFGRLTVIERGDNNKSGAVQWICQCICGNKTIATANNLQNHSTQSCGCLAREITIKRSTIHGHTITKRTKEYIAWSGIKMRCYNKNFKDYFRYGGRGIIMCEKWKNNFQAFFDDMGYCPSNKNSIDRIDGNRGYEPDNCRWANWIEQARNRNSNHIIKYKGVKLLLIDWARITGLSRYTISKRLKNGWTIKSALKTPLKRIRA